MKKLLLSIAMLLMAISVFAQKEVYPRRMVVEEGTGTWCQYCVWGIVGMEYMAKNYPDNFIGIAVHSGDQMDIEDVYGLSYSSFPSAYFNRKELSSPSSYTMEQFLKNQSGLTTNAMVKINSVTYSDDYKHLKVSANTRFAFDKTGADYRLAYVITEDEVGPYLQNNAYAGESGEMGGFEKLPSPTPVVYNDVARGIYPSLTGVEGSVPTTISACTDYSYDYSIDIPKNYDNSANLKLTILLYDATTGEIMNADRAACPAGKSNIELSVDMGDEPGTLAEKLGDQIGYIYSLTLSGKINGLDLATLRSMMGCTDDMKCLTHLDLRNANIVKGGEYMDGKNLNEDNILPYEVFSNTSSLHFFATPFSLKEIGSYALNCAGAIKEIVLNEGLEKIGWGAFSVNDAGSTLKKLNIPSTVKTLRGNFIERCYLLTDFSLDPNNPYFDFDGNAIYTKGYKELVTIIPSYKGEYNINEKCNSIMDQAICSNSSITGIVATHVSTIGDLVFWDATKMQYLAIGSLLKSIGSLTFSYCYQLDKIYLGCTEVPMGRYKDSTWDEIGNCTLYVPSASIEKYKADTFWGKMKDIKPIEGTEYEYLMEPKEEPTVTFVDNLGNTYDEGAVIKMDNYHKSVFGDYVSLIGLNIKNISDQGTLYRLTASIDQLPGGSFQCCLGDACRRLSKPGSITIEGISDNGGDLIPIIDTEWIVEKEKYGTLDVAFTLESSTDGTKYTKAGMVTVQFVYTLETGIDAINVDTNNDTNIYTIDGRHVEIPTKGFYIINGKKIVK